jgi:hypothetical protein
LRGSSIFAEWSKFEPKSDSEVRVSHKLLAMAYVTTVVEKRPEILIQCQLVTDSGADQPHAQLHALALHDDD